MEQAEYVLLTERVIRVETDVTVLKAHQFEHECQIETLAFEIHTTNERIDDLEKTMKFGFKRLDHKIDALSKDLKHVLEALAIKY